MSYDNAYAELLFRTAKRRPDFLPGTLPTLAKPAPGRPASCVGTTLVIVIVPFVMSVQLSAMKRAITQSWLPDMPCSPRLANVTPRAGQATRVTGWL